MYHQYHFVCNRCGDEIESDYYCDSFGNCNYCDNGLYIFGGESYDEEWVDEQKYNRQQDQEYEERHRYDRF